MHPSCSYLVTRIWNATDQIQPLLLLDKSRRDLFDLGQIAHVTRHPLDLCIGPGFLLDFVDRFLPLVFLTVDHDDAGAVQHKRPGDFIAGILSA